MSKKRNIPLTRADFIRVYRNNHSKVRHEYLALAKKHAHLKKTMLTFTVGGKGRGVYTKLRIINEVRKHLTHLINVAKANTYYFAAIEIADNFTNPHLHVQIWTDDIKSVEAIRLKVIDKFNLNEPLCHITYETSTPPDIYTYVLKDYSSNLSDDQIWNLERTKKRMRNTLGLQLRFYSRSKGKYTQKVYRFFYKFFGVLRNKADEYIEWFYSLFFRKQRVFKTSTIFLFLYITRVYERVFFFNFHFFFGDVISFYGFAPACAPPSLVLRLDFNFKGDILFLLCFILFSITLTVYRLLWVPWVGLFSDLKIICLLFTIVFVVEVRCLSPPLLLLVLEKK